MHVTNHIDLLLQFEHLTKVTASNCYIIQNVDKQIIMELRHFASVILFRNIKVNEKHCEKYGIYNPSLSKDTRKLKVIFSIVFAEVASQSTSVKTSPIRLVSVCFVGVFTD